MAALKMKCPGFVQYNLTAIKVDDKILKETFKRGQRWSEQSKEKIIKMKEIFQ